MSDDLIKRLRGQVAMSTFANTGSMWAELEEQRRLAADRIAALESELKALREQEPVAWMWEYCGQHMHEGSAKPAFLAPDVKAWPLYAAPVPAQEDARDADRCMNLILTAESRGFGVAYMKGVAQGYLNRHGTDAAILAAKGGDK